MYCSKTYIIYVLKLKPDFIIPLAPILSIRRVGSENTDISKNVMISVSVYLCIDSCLRNKEGVI